MLGFRSAWKDIQNYREWISVINSEKNNALSQYNKFGIDHNFTYMIYLVITLPQEEAGLPDHIKRQKVIEMLSPVNRYLDEELRFAEYLVPEFNQVFDEFNQPTMNYVIAYRFAFKTLSFKWFMWRASILGAITYGTIKFDLITKLQEWILSLT